MQDALQNSDGTRHGASVLTKGKEPVALFTFIHDDETVELEKLIEDLFDSQVSRGITSRDHQRSVETFSQSLFG